MKRGVEGFVLLFCETVHDLEVFRLFFKNCFNAQVPKKLVQLKFQKKI